MEQKIEIWYFKLMMRLSFTCIRAKSFATTMSLRNTQEARIDQSFVSNRCWDQKLDRFPSLSIDELRGNTNTDSASVVADGRVSYYFTRIPLHLLVPDEVGAYALHGPSGCNFICEPSQHFFNPLKL
eukprot:scaffold56506_cov34-Attheya_sp.AAC.2